MDWFASNWPAAIVLLAVVVVVLGLAQRLIKLALVAAIIGALALVVWPMVGG